jgi:hypothetical protein
MIERADLVVDTTFAMDEIDEAIDVVFAAIKGAQRSLHAIPDNASPIEVRNEWRLHNVLVRQAICLIDERVQELAKATRRLARAS